MRITFLHSKYNEYFDLRENQKFDKNTTILVTLDSKSALNESSGSNENFSLSLSTDSIMNESINKSTPFKSGQIQANVSVNMSHSTPIAFNSNTSITSENVNQNLVKTIKALVSSSKYSVQPSFESAEVSSWRIKIIKLVGTHLMETK